MKLIRKSLLQNIIFNNFIKVTKKYLLNIYMSEKNIYIISYATSTMREPMDKFDIIQNN